MLEVLSRLRVERNFLSLIKDVFEHHYSEYHTSC